VLVESQAMGTAGGLVGLPKGPDHWLVRNVDHVSDVDMAGLIAAHRGAATAVVTERRHVIPEGVVDTRDGRITAYTERPSVAVEVTTGLYLFSARALRRHLDGSACDMPALIQRMIPEGVGVWRHRGTWFDAGTPERLGTAEAWWLSACSAVTDAAPVQPVQ
jgi:mannose-1-phosphate guanylyltransferase